MAKRFILEQKALRVIERLVSDDLSEDCSITLFYNRPFTQKNSKLMARKITRIYEIAHSAVKEHTCFDVHNDWRKKTLSLFRQLLKEDSDG